MTTPQSALARQLAQQNAQQEEETASVSIRIQDTPPLEPEASGPTGSSLSEFLLGRSLPGSLKNVTPFSQGALGHWIGSSAKQDALPPGAGSSREESASALVRGHAEYLGSRGEGVSLDSEGEEDILVPLMSIEEEEGEDEEEARNLHGSLPRPCRDLTDNNLFMKGPYKEAWVSEGTHDAMKMAGKKRMLPPTSSPAEDIFSEKGRPEELAEGIPYGAGEVDERKEISSKIPLTIVRHTSADGEPQTALQKPRNRDALTALVFGGINAFATLPSLVAFAAIVFKHPMYIPYLDILCRLYFLSSAVHQTIFSMLSSLPFAVGQVQDVGLIFLSSMASSIATVSHDAGKDASVALSTSLVTMVLATFFTGAGCLLITKLRLAGIVQRVPVPVVGGYLGFVGYFCIASGVSLGCGVDLESLLGWYHLATSPHALIKFLPTAGTCLSLLFVQHRFASPLALPALMIGIVAVFHVVLHAVLGLSLQDAIADGWCLASSKGSFEFWKMYSYLYSTNIYVPAALRQIPLFFGLLLVVLFGSAMDIIAIQQESPQPIDFDKELTTVSVSNIATALVGAGATGSYIFSQTVFTMRAGITSRWNGVVIIVVELLAFGSPSTFLQYVPNFLYGALLAWFGVEIARDWLFLSYKMMTIKEFCILWLTFMAIMQWGLELGIAAGIVLAIIYFTWAYSQSQSASLKVRTGHELKGQSGVIRSLDQSAVLDIFFPASVALVRMKGFLFFGSAQSIHSTLQHAAERLSNASLCPEHLKDLTPSQQSAIVSTSSKYLILDLSELIGIDASGAKVIGGLCQQLLRNGVCPLFASMKSDEWRYLLSAHGVQLTPTPWPPGEMLESSEDLVHSRGLIREFSSASMALRFCEDQIVQVAVVHGFCAPVLSTVSLESALAQHITGFLGETVMDLDAHATAASQAASELLRYMSRMSLSRGHFLWRLGEPAQEMFLIEKGAIRIDEIVEEETGADHGTRKRHIRSFEMSQGCVAGATDFFLCRAHGTRALCISEHAVVLQLNKPSFRAMSEACPEALNALQLLIMRTNTLDLAAAASSHFDVL